MPDTEQVNGTENGAAKETKESEASTSVDPPVVNETPASSSSSGSEPNSNADETGGIDTAATSPEKDPPDSEEKKEHEGASTAPGAVPDPPKEPEEPEEVPDVLYCLDYRDFSGSLIHRKRDSKPIDVNSLPKTKDKKDAPVEKKPVLEIVTEVRSHPRGPSRRRVPIYPRRRSIRSRSSSRATSPISISPDRAPPPRRRPTYFSSSDEEEFEPVESNKAGKTSMIIHSPYLNSVIRNVVKYWPGDSLLRKRLTFDEPYVMIVHHRKELEEYKTNHPPTHPEDYREECNRHIDILLNFIEESVGPAIKVEEERHKKDPPLCTMEYLWLLFKPGEEAYMTDDYNSEKRRAVVVTKVLYLKDDKYEIDSFNIKYDGKMIDVSKWWTDLYSFEGEREISELILYPTRFHQEKLDKQDGLPLREFLITHGKRYWKHCQQAYMDYSGRLADRGPNSKKFNGKVNGRVIIDVKAWNQFAPEKAPSNPSLPGPPGGPRRRLKAAQSANPGGPRKGPPPPTLDYMSLLPGACTCEYCKDLPSTLTTKRFRGYKYWDPKKDAAPDDDTIYHLCNDTLEGYILSDREWGVFDVSSLKEPVMSNAFDYLVLDEDIKSTIKSLVWRYDSEGSVMPWSADFIKGKGEGQIFLLHGAPGVGKTCTAECVADLTKRPLLSITCGDMGTTPEDVEENLDEFLQLGELWGAILLLDEADIYLEQRDSENLSRNALVSVFLRALEYYKGILFLTTNRVGTFDDAFISRIHVALHYRDLTDADREKIWTNSFERLENEKRPKMIKIPYSTKEYATESKEMKEIKWNGREIRNAFQTAVALAEYEANKEHSEVVTLKDRHLKSVVKMSRSFKEYLRSTHKNQDASKRARMFEWRNDNFGKQES